LKKNVKWRLALIAASIVMAVIYLLPSTPAFNAMPQWWREAMPSEGITLGLDLQGGMHLVFEVEWDKAVEVTTDRLADGLRNSLKEKELSAEVKREESGISVIPGDGTDADAIRTVVDEEYSQLEESGFGGDTLSFRLNAQEAKTIRQNSVDQALETIRNRIDQFGVAEPTIVRQGENEILIQLPGVKDEKRQDPGRNYEATR